MHTIGVTGPRLSMLILEDEVRRLLPMSRAIECVESVMRAMADGKAQNIPRSRVRLPGATLHVMAAGDATQGFFGVKAYSTTRAGNRFIMLLFAIESGELVATIEANALGQIRTGAASGVATRWMARLDARVLGVIGAGFQARTQIEAVCQVRPIQEVRVFSRNPERRDAFVSAMRDGVPAQVIAVDSARECVENADIVTTITTSRDPVFEGNWLKPGVHVNAAGSNALTRREIDLQTVRRCARIVVDSWEQARIECGDLLPAIEENRVNWEQVIELSEIVAGRQPGRMDEQEITLFESHGIAAWDLAVACEVYRRATASPPAPAQHPADLPPFDRLRAT